MHRHLRRLDRIFVSHPVYFVTTCTYRRRPILANPAACSVLVREWRTARKRHGWGIGRFVVMPDHVHFFCAEMASLSDQQVHSLSKFVGAWKEWTAKALLGEGLGSPVWQSEFFDHVLRDDESYAEKWQYVRENPVRNGLVPAWHDWPYQGWIDFDTPRGS